MPKIVRFVLNRGNDDFEGLVRSVLDHVFPEGSKLIIGKEPGSAELVIWNYHPGDDLPVSATSGSDPVMLYAADRENVCELETGKLATVMTNPVRQGDPAGFLRAASSITGIADSEPPADSVRKQRDELLHALMQANVRLQEYDRDRTNFLGRAVHDFRAPLSALTGYCGLLISGQLGPVSEKQRDVLVRMRQSAVRLAELADGLLDLSAGLRSHREPELRETDLRQCVERAIERSQALIEEKSLEISIDLAPPAGVLLLDVAALEQVCATLMDNACRSTPRGAYVEVAGYSFRAQYYTVADQNSLPASEALNCYRIDFRDAGTDVAASHLSEIFAEHISPSAFSQSPAGLAFATCRMIIAQHGGHIWAENGDSGPVFSLVLPFAASQSPCGEAQAAYAQERI
jgi:signal transduction histidine kinase